VSSQPVYDTKGRTKLTILFASLPPTIKYRVYVLKVDRAGAVPSSDHCTDTEPTGTEAPAAGDVNLKSARASEESAARRGRWWRRMTGGSTK